jgi:hypothetical protein
MPAPINCGTPTDGERLPKGKETYEHERERPSYRRGGQAAGPGLLENAGGEGPPGGPHGSHPQTWRSAWESLPGMVTGAWKTIRWVARTSSSTSTLSQEASRWTFQGRGHCKVRGAVERQALDVPGGQKPGDQGYLLPRLEGKEVAGHGQTSSRTQPHRLHEVRRRLRTTRGESKDRSPRRPRYLILGRKEGTGTRLLTFTW